MTAVPAYPSIHRLVAHGIAGWALCAAAMGGLLQIAPLGVAIVVHAILAPLIFTALAAHYFRARGAREPLPVAVAWTAIVAALDAAGGRPTSWEDHAGWPGAEKTSARRPRAGRSLESASRSCSFGALSLV